MKMAKKKKKIHSRPRGIEHLINQEKVGDRLTNRKITIGHLALYLENEAGYYVAEEDYQLLESVIKETRDRLPRRINYSPDQARDTLLTIDNILKEHGLEIEETNRAMTLCESLKTRKVDCDNIALLYLSIAQQTNLPLKAILAPAHMGLRWSETSREYFNWNPTENISRTDELFMRAYNIPQSSVDQRIYLSSLTRNELIGILYMRLGRKAELVGNERKALEYYDKAAEFHPRSPEALHNRGTIRCKLRDFEGAIADFDQSLEFYPYSALTYACRGLAKVMINDDSRALEDFSSALELKPQLAIALAQRSNIYRKQGNNEAALEDLNTYVEKSQTSDALDALNRRADLLVEMGNYEAAIHDCDAAIGLDQDFAVAYATKAEALYARWHQTNNQHDLNDSMKNLDRCIQLLQEIPPNVHLLRSKVLESLGRTEEAQSALSNYHKSTEQQH